MGFQHEGGMLAPRHVVHAQIDQVEKPVRCIVEHEHIIGHVQVPVIINPFRQYPGSMDIYCGWGNRVPAWAQGNVKIMGGRISGGLALFQDLIVLLMHDAASYTIRRVGIGVRRFGAGQITVAPRF